MPCLSCHSNENSILAKPIMAGKLFNIPLMYNCVLWNTQSLKLKLKFNCCLKMFVLNIKI